MSKPGIEDYSFSAKHQWRKKVWREIARRTDYKRKARILYLAGEQDLDRKEAVKHGFDPGNMIAVKIDPGRAKALRRNGVTTINADLLEVLHNWPDHKKVGVVVADFCFGLEKGAIDLYDSLINPAFRDACVLVNFQRGRDPSTNQIRKALGGRKLFLGNTATDQIRDTDVDEKHRAFQFLFWHAYETVYVAMHGETEAFPIDMMDDPQFAAMVSLFLHGMRATFRTYRSGFALRMDSAVFNHNLKGAKIPKMLEPGMRRILEPFNPKIKRQISAALAVQTMRKSA